MCWNTGTALAETVGSIQRDAASKQENTRSGMLPLGSRKHVLSLIPMFDMLISRQSAGIQENIVIYCDFLSSHSEFLLWMEDCYHQMICWLPCH